MAKRGEIEECFTALNSAVTASRIVMVVQSVYQHWKIMPKKTYFLAQDSFLSVN